VLLLGEKLSAAQALDAVPVPASSLLAALGSPSPSAMWAAAPGLIAPLPRYRYRL